VISLSRSMFGSKHTSRGDGYGYGGLGSSWSGPFLSPSDIDDWTSCNPIGLTAFACAIRLVSETIASFILRVYEGDAQERQPLLDAPQAALFQDGAENYSTSFDMWSDVVTSIELCGNGFIYKGRRRAGGQVTELYAFPAENTCVYVDDSGKKIVEATIGGEKYDITKDVIHIRNWSPTAGVSGSSVTSLHRTALRGSVSMMQFRGRWFDSDATPNIVLSNPGTLTPEQRADMRQSWNARHSGANGDKTAVLWGGMTVQQLAANLEQSQMAQLMTADVLQVAQMVGIYPPSILAAVIEQPLPAAEILSDSLLRFTLLKRIRRIERAVSADPDIFPDRRGPYARFDVAEFTRGSIATTVTKVHSLTQVGLLTKNEGRSEIGLPPIDGGDVIQETPVGGAPNAEQLALFQNGNGVHAELSPAVDPA
jgi:HK97 family phage portal protein